MESSMKGTRRSAAIIAIVAAVTALAVPAFAANTTTTFSLSGGTLSISAPSSTVNLGSAATGASTVSAQLGTVTVTDARGALAGSWTATASSTDFTTGGATADETVTKGNIYYWSGAATASSGTAVFTPGQLLVANETALSSAKTAFSASAIVGNDSASWNPTIDVHIPAAAVAGTYTGTITHSVA